MSRLRNSLLILALPMFFGCPLISFENLAVKIWPESLDTILEIGASPWVEFPEWPDRPGAERLLSVSSPDGQISGDFRWDGKRVYFDPVPAFSPGMRYVLTFRGRVTLENGESFDANEEVPFYVGHGGPAPRLASCNLPNGAQVGTGQILVLSFSASIDPGSFARELDLQPSAEFTVIWDASWQTATVSPKDAWANLTTYTWKVGKALSAPDGTPTGIEYSGSFRVQADVTVPVVASMVPASKADFTPVGSALGQIKADDAILITFSEDVQQETLVSAFSLSPATLGSWVRVRSGVFAFTPGSRWIMSQLYTVRVAATVKDMSGNKMAFPYQETFTPEIPEQMVQSIKEASSEAELTPSNMLEAKNVSVDVEGNLELVLTFTQAFLPENYAAFVSAIVFDAYFPSTLSDPSLTTAQWSGGLTLSLAYTGLEKSEPGVAKYYKLTLPGGAASPDNGSGSFLKEDVWLYFVSNP